MDNLKFKRIYEYVMIILALLVVGLLIVEFTMDLSERALNRLAMIDLGVLIIFSVDYFTRLVIANNKKLFVLHNKADLIAIIPFSSIFRIFRLARLARLARISRINRLVRAGIWAEKLRIKLRSFFNTNGLIYMITIAILMVLSGALGIYVFEGMRFSDGIWWSFVTTTTVGYGDMSPESTGGRIVAGILMLVGIGFIGMLTGTIATYFLKGDSEQNTFKKEVIVGIKGKLDEYDSLTAEDIEDMVSILRSLKKNSN